MVKLIDELDEVATKLEKKKKGENNKRMNRTKQNKTSREYLIDVAD